MLKILVCVKQVPDVELIRMDPETGMLVRDGVPAILNPLDANALASAISLKEQYGGEITLIIMGPPMAEAVLRECIAVGTERKRSKGCSGVGGSQSKNSLDDLLLSVRCSGLA